MPDAAAAEAASVAALSLLASAQDGAVLIGGYAVSSFAFGRTSVDLDLVIDGGKAPPARALLEASGFALSRSRKLQGGHYAGAFELWRHPSGGRVDLLIGGVQDRKVGVWLPHGYLAKNSEKREVRAVFGAPPVRCNVASRDLLIALKLQPFRLVDRRDIFALCFDAPDAKALRRHLEQLGNPILGTRLRQMPAIVEERSFEDSFKGVYRVVSERVLARLKRNLGALVREASTGSA